MKPFVVFSLIIIFAFPTHSIAQEKKSLPLVIGSALSPIGVGAVVCSIELEVGLFRVTPFALATMPIISHGYLGDYSGGTKLFIIKGAAALMTVEGLWLADPNYKYSGLGDALFVSGSVILLISYLYEIYYLVNKTKEINKKASEGVEVGFYPTIYKDQVGLGVSLNF